MSSASGSCKQAPNMQADCYSRILRSIISVQDRLNGNHGQNRQLNGHQCMFIAKKLLEVSDSLQKRDRANLKLAHVQNDVRVRNALVHLHGSVRRAQMLVERAWVERCCSEDFSWLAAAMTLRHFKEEVAVILLALEWATMNLDIALSSLSGSSCGYQIVKLLKKGESDYQRLLVSLQSSEHELHIAACKDREKLQERITKFLEETKGDQHEDDYLRAIYLKSQLSEPKGNLQDEKKLRLDRPPKSLLGEGSTGLVYKQNWLGLEVALKELRYVDKKEATLLSRIEHPHVVQFFHYWEDDEEQCHHSFIVMEFMPRDLKKYIKISKSESTINAPFPLPVAIDIMLQVAEAMRHLHYMKLIHRDLKPKNILVKPVDESMIDLHNEGYSEVKLADFGSAKACENSSSCTPFTLDVGTTTYGPPEIFNKEEIKRKRYYVLKVDVWNFGMACFEILSGKPPFKGEGMRNLHKKIFEGLRPTLPADCPEYLKFCITSCWELEPERRPSFNDLCKMLRNAKVLSLGMLDWDSTIFSSLFVYEARAGFMKETKMNSVGSGDEKDEVPANVNCQMEHCWSSKRKQGADSQVACCDADEADRASTSHHYPSQNRLHASAAAYTYSTKDDDDYTARILQQSGIAKLRKREYEEALKDLDAANSYSPDDCLTLQQRGIVKLRLHDCVGALQDLDAADKLSPDDRLTLEQRAIAKVMLGDNEGAKKDVVASWESVSHCAIEVRLSDGRTT